MILSFAPAIALGIFAAVILAIASNRMHMTVAASLGTALLLVTGCCLRNKRAKRSTLGEDTIALFFGGMVVARTLISRGLDERSEVAAGKTGRIMTRQDKLGDALLAGAMWAIPSALITLALVYLLEMPLLLIPGAIATFGVAACIMLRDDH